MLGYTHHWNDEWRSTATYGYVHLTNLASQDPTAGQGSTSMAGCSARMLAAVEVALGESV